MRPRRHKKTTNKSPNKSSLHGLPGFCAFELPPALELTQPEKLKLRAGYQFQSYKVSNSSGVKLPYLVARVSAPHLISVFSSLMRCLLDSHDIHVTVVLETSHFFPHGHDDIVIEDVDGYRAIELFEKYPDIILGDGCAGFAVFSKCADDSGHSEIQLNENREFRVYSGDIRPFIGVFRSFDISEVETFPVLSDEDHRHRVGDIFRFEDLADELAEGNDSDSCKYAYDDGDEEC